MSRSRSFPVALAVVLAGCATATDVPPRAAEPQNPIVHEAGTEIGFHRKCADAEPFWAQAYGAFRSGDGRVRALANLHARRDPVRLTEVVVGMRLVAMQVDAGPEWADAPLALRMDARSQGRRIVGADHAEYSANPAPGTGERRSFRTDARGRMAWLDFIEPTEPEGKTDRAYNWSPSMEVSATELGLTEPERRVLLDLTLTHRDTGDEIRLTGPSLRVPDRIWNETPPKPRVLGLVATLNPFDRGSVWAWLANSARYRHCIEERRAAKRWFGAGAMPEKSGRHSRPAAGGGHSTVTNTGLE